VISFIESSEDEEEKDDTQIEKEPRLKPVEESVTEHQKPENVFLSTDDSALNQTLSN
jgi:hypothetical protein